MVGFEEMECRSRSSMSPSSFCSRADIKLLRAESKSSLLRLDFFLESMFLFFEAIIDALSFS